MCFNALRTRTYVVCLQIPMQCSGCDDVHTQAITAQVRDLLSHVCLIDHRLESQLVHGNEKRGHHDIQTSQHSFGSPATPLSTIAESFSAWWPAIKYSHDCVQVKWFNKELTEVQKCGRYMKSFNNCRISTKKKKRKKKDHRFFKKKGNKNTSTSNVHLVEHMDYIYIYAECRFLMSPRRFIIYSFLNH